MGIKGTKWIVKKGIPTTNAEQYRNEKRLEKQQYEDYMVNTSEKKIFEAIRESERCDEWN